MNFLTAKSFLLVFVIGSYALRTRSSITPSLLDFCPSVQEISSSTISIDGHEILHQVLSCLDGNVNASSISTRISSHLPKKRTLIADRSAAECTTPNPECQCGTAVDNCGCINNGPTPSSEDCNTLVASLPIISTLNGRTFIVAPNTLMSITLNTCQFGLLNMASTNTEYCWDDMAVSGNDIKFCMSSIDFASGACVADDERFLIFLGPIN
ncbi:hypothetical protein ACEPAG_2461 [Sanghuangporus baumii]